jgi:hypothetical protein
MRFQPRRHATAIAATLSLLAGCASPTLPPPVVTAGAETPSAPAAAPVEAAPVVADEAPVTAVPETVALAPVVFEGVASYRGEPLASYTIRVYHLGTDALLTQTPSADGLAILSQTATTDASGRYRVELAGLQPGFDVRVAASSPQESGTLFATLSAPDAASPEATAGQGAIDEESTLVSLLTEGPSRLLWAAVEPAEPAPAGYRVAQSKPSTKLKPLTPPQKQVLAAKTDYKAEVSALAKPTGTKTKAAPYALSAEILDAANQTIKTQKAVAKVSEPASKRALFATETKKLNAKLTTVVNTKGIQAPLTKAAVKLVTAIAKGAAPTPGAKPTSTRPPMALLGTPLAVTVAPSGLPSAVVNTATQKELDLATVSTSGGAALDAGFTAPSKPSGNNSPSTPAPEPLPAPEVSAVNQLTASAGTLITVTGANFSPTLSDNVVTINGATATPQSVTSTRLVVAVPAGAALGSDHLSVAVRGVTAATLVDFTVVARGTVLRSISVGATPTGVAVDSAGDVYVALLSENVVKRFRNGSLHATYATGADTGTVTVDRYDNVWVTTGAGLKRIVDGVVSSTGITGVSITVLDGAGRLWAARSNLDILTCLTLDDQDGYTAEHITLPQSSGWLALAASGSTVWVGSRQLRTIIPVTNGVAGTPVDINPSASQLGMHAMVGAPGGNVWVSAFPYDYNAGTYLVRVGGSPAAVTDADYISGFAENLRVGADGAVWGTLRYRYQLVRFNADGTVSDTFGASQPIGLTADAAGNLWVTTIDDGRIVQYAP